MRDLADQRQIGQMRCDPALEVGVAGYGGAAPKDQHDGQASFEERVADDQQPQTATAIRIPISGQASRVGVVEVNVFPATLGSLGPRAAPRGAFG
ncbi:MULTISPECIES: hypothetical protein [Rhodococcus]|uniref:Uncharacterized protein n=1 Tax=Rhodococcus oxybenzonivorans TaxID=1990687 RepID=A0AAE4UY11_9NOCA|nr:MULTISPECIES: hypothetical protein [Rhodococcus]MDV7246403.1 hypothetical protein [Rhodococcus oxybenzonivorans]MDV7265138.1 hypothetical protein [Rhodococcus oxybenzonivorans]MDV7278008.1 hypothetical protein [Rhodococcus oxybenzonivorans]MDV7337415.1 hypothetical protein [Rhodococcus oxybenzonivorans]MDV7347520.1 hypothetical protein [Rhodococcus oxybenzonivorans]